VDRHHGRVAIGIPSLGVLVAGLFFSAVQTGSLGMERNTEVARELSRVIQAVIIMLIASRAAFRANRRDQTASDV